VEGLGSEPVEDAFTGVVRGDAVRQAQQAFQPIVALTAEGLNLLPILGAGDDGAERDHENILQQVQPSVGPAGVL
jgi:hypothetical protein